MEGQLKWTAQASITEEGDIKLTTTREFMGTQQAITHQVMRLQDKAVREALKKLGWTPPPNEP